MYINVINFYFFNFMYFWVIFNICGGFVYVKFKICNVCIELYVYVKFLVFC